MLGIAVGVAQWITASAPQPILNDTFNMLFGSGNFGPVPGLIVWSAIFVAIGAVVLSAPNSAARCWPPAATGPPPTSPGINTKRIKFQVLLISGDGRQRRRHALRRTAPVRPLPVGHRRRTLRNRGRDPRRHQPLRRSGSVVGTLFGALLIGLINNGLILAGLDSSQQQVVRGAIIILAVALARKK